VDFRLIYIKIFFLSVAYLHGQNINVQDDQIFEIKWSNDFVFSSDYYFSNGLELVYYAPAFKKSPVRHLLISHKEAYNIWYGLTLTQHFFTPRDLSGNEINLTDRPFASYLLIGQKPISAMQDRQIKITSEIRTGIFGKYSGGQSIQNGIHELLPASKPVSGWHSQLNSEIALNYILKVEKGLTNSPFFNAIPYAEVLMGTPYTDLSGGIRFVIGKQNSLFIDPGVRNCSNMELYVFTDMSGRLVGYNATLQGGLFSTDSHALHSINRLVGQFTTGIVWRVNRFSIEYGQTFLAKEFDSGLSHKWAYVSLKLAF